MRRIDNLSPDELSLDRMNPRFGLHTAEDEVAAIEILIEKANLKELWDSIAERGYEQFEPLVATREDDLLVVLEGNRRLAAVKILLSRDLAGSDVVRRRIPHIDPDKLSTCKSLPVVIVKDRAEAAGYIGFKHVNGPARWSSLAKAKFGVDLFESLPSAMSSQQKMQSLTKQLGDSRGLIIRLLVAYKIVRQALSLGILDDLEVDSEKMEFSHLYTIINNPETRQFIGLSRAPLGENMIVDNPVPASDIRALEELLGYLYGARSVIKAQGTDRPRLQKVLGSPEGLRELRATGNLDAAEAVAGVVSEDWLKNLAKIMALVQKSAADIALVVECLSEDDIRRADSYLKRVELNVRQIRSTFPGA